MEQNGGALDISPAYFRHNNTNNNNRNRQWAKATREEKNNVYTNQQVDFSKFIALRIDRKYSNVIKPFSLNYKNESNTKLTHDNRFSFHSSSCSAVKHACYVYLKICVYCLYSLTQTHMRASAQRRAKKPIHAIHVLFDVSSIHPFFLFNFHNK